MQDTKELQTGSMLQISRFLAVLMWLLTLFCGCTGWPAENFSVKLGRTLLVTIGDAAVLLLLELMMMSMRHCYLDYCTTCVQQVMAACCWCATNCSTAR